MALSGSITISSQWSQSPAAVPGGQPLPTNITRTWTSTDGTAVNQANRKYAKPLTLAATPTVLDLTSLTDFEGNAIAFSRVKSILVLNLSTTPGQVVLFGYAATTANAFVGPVSNPGQIAIRPSTSTSPGFLSLVAPDATGYACGSSNKLINLDPGANTVSVLVEIVGTT